MGAHLPQDHIAIGDKIWEEMGKQPGTNRTQLRNIARAAQKSLDNAAAIRANPGSRNAVQANQYAVNRSLNRITGQYEYRVVLRGAGAGNEFETMIIVQSRVKRSADELNAMVLRRFRNNAALQQHYAAEIAALGTAPAYTTVVVGASRNPPYSA